MIKRQTDQEFEETAVAEDASASPLSDSITPSAETTTVAAKPIIRLVGVHKSFGRVHVLNGITEEFPRGKTTVVLGPSGTGKSVMLKCIVGLLRPDDGEVWFEDQRVDLLSETKLGPIRRQFGFLFQQGALFD